MFSRVLKNDQELPKAATLGQLLEISELLEGECVDEAPPKWIKCSRK
jgi:hypothetical protein